MLLKLLSELGAQCLNTIDLLCNLLPNLNDFFIDVSTEEMRPLSRVMSCVFNVFHQLLQGLITGLLDCSHFNHHILDQALDQLLALTFWLESTVNLHLNHLREFLSHLNLLRFETFNIITNWICYFANFSAKVDFLLSPSKLLLFHPTIDGSNLGLQRVLQGHDGFILSLKFTSYNSIHGCVTVTHFLSFVFLFLLSHFILDV